ncbi:hypothetical protein WM36_17215 [Burkholderia ubonensis]|nr:hypothetical protein WM36_17215 [Burkholderia ubonensis]KVD37927.1 hypothetical protein WI83_05910 [Burkholderia ubonensis]
MQTLSEQTGQAHTEPHVDTPARLAPDPSTLRRTPSVSPGAVSARWHQHVRCCVSFAASGS